MNKSVERATQAAALCKDSAVQTAQGSSDVGCDPIMEIVQTVSTLKFNHSVLNF